MCRRMLSGPLWSIAEMTHFWWYMCKISPLPQFSHALSFADHVNALLCSIVPIVRIVGLTCHRQGRKVHKVCEKVEWNRGQQSFAWRIEPWASHRVHPECVELILISQAQAHFLCQGECPGSTKRAREILIPWKGLMVPWQNNHWSVHTSWFLRVSNVLLRCDTVWLWLKKFNLSRSTMLKVIRHGDVNLKQSELINLGHCCTVHINSS